MNLKDRALAWALRRGQCWLDLLTTGMGGGFHWLPNRSCYLLEARAEQILMFLSTRGALQKQLPVNTLEGSELAAGSSLTGFVWPVWLGSAKTSAQFNANVRK